LDAFYILNPDPGAILFYKLDGWAVPPLYSARKYLPLSESPEADATMICSWASGAIPSSIHDEEDDPTQLRNLVTRIPRGPRVEARWITAAIVSAYAEFVRSQGKAASLVAEANDLALVEDSTHAGSKTISLGDLPIFGVVPPFEFWQAAFDEARLKGPRMVVSLLLVQSDEEFPARARADRARLLQYLRYGHVEAS